MKNPGIFVPIDVKITELNALPAKYFQHDEVVQALRRVVRSDVVVHGAPVPPGAEAIMAPEGSLSVAAAKLSESRSAFGLALRKEWRTLALLILAMWLSIASALLVYWGIGA